MNPLAIPTKPAQADSFADLTEALAGSIVLPDMSNTELEPAILEALAYSDIFEYPLQLNELHRYLPVYASEEELMIALESLNDTLGKQDDFYFLVGRSEIVEIRKQREVRSKSLVPHAIRYGKILGALPFVRMVALTGSLAVMNVSNNADFDYMLVTEQGRVWTARAFALLLNRVANLCGHTLCPNLIVAETALEWSARDLYSARELCQMIPIAGLGVYKRLMKANEWAKDFLPNGSHDFSRGKTATKVATTFQSFLELPLRSKLGDKFESWEMNRKIAKFSKQAGFGEETVFNADVCQGNFSHHRKWTHDIFQQRLNNLGNDSPLPLEEGLGVRVK